MKVREFFSKNMVMIVMVPFLFGAHYGWLRLQSVEELVPTEDRKRLPILNKLMKDLHPEQ